MNRLTDALGRLEAPDCPNCHVGMRWFRSELVRDAQEAIIAHLFVCPNCKRARCVETSLTPACVPPDELSAARLRLVKGGKS